MDQDVGTLSHAELLEAYRQLSTRAEQLRTNYELQRRQLAAIGRLTTRSTQVAQLSKELNTFDIDQIVHVAIEKIPHLFAARYCSLFLYDYESNALNLKAHNHSEPISEQVSLAREPDTIMAMAISADQPLLIENLNQFERERGVRIRRTKTDKYLTNSCLICPLMTGSGQGTRRVMGVLNIADRADGASFDRDDLNVAVQLSELIGTAVSTSILVGEMRSLAETDGLTRLSNHRVFREALDREIRRAGRYGGEFSLVMLDIDRFKRFNDDHGHLAGDHVLRTVSRAIRRTVREGVDLAARYGGEEFAVILPETGMAGAITAAERLRAAVAGAESVFDGHTFQVTASLGAAEFRPGMSASELIDAADRAMYMGKRTGRNRVCYFDAAAGEPRPAPEGSDSGPAPAAGNPVQGER
ncbi:MAG TPA: sensor domain-containing diguanylate cyclase [Planctomycetota bacterium]|nr:sensor domain-containing diguanylate cyclase [Planctomycetota bacterium]